jgi:large subunit ribosomal protein L35
MPKLKTHRGTAKRIKLSATGKVMREKANNIHFNEKKSESRKRRIESKASVTGGNARNIKRALGALK